VAQRVTWLLGTFSPRKVAGFYIVYRHSPSSSFLNILFVLSTMNNISITPLYDDDMICTTLLLFLFLLGLALYEILEDG
jgi:hypothetical protein